MNHQVREGEYRSTLSRIDDDATANTPNAVRVQIRTPDGKRLVRRILKSDPVRLLFLFLRHQITDAQHKPFELRTTHPPKEIVESDTSIEAEQLINATVVMQWSTL